ncbi:MAG: hypothetical protein K5696_08000, partial [Lachnospiraceae bacterium]|nr:hypothetical protein [Lachnospiraceae bacterium]
MRTKKGDAMKHFIKSIRIAGILITIGIALLSAHTTARAEGEWYDEYDYALNPADQTIRLKRYMGSGGDIVVPGSATIDGITYQTVIAGEYGLNPFKSNENLTGIVFESGVLMLEKCNAMFAGDRNL